MNLRTIGFLAILSILVLSSGALTASAQYQTQKVANFAISNNGTANIPQSLTAGNLAITIFGTPGATGSVTTAVYNANPQPTAHKPDSVILGHFAAVSFSIKANDFKNATIKINFNTEDVSGAHQSYILYQYSPQDNSYKPVSAQIDNNAKTATIVLTSATDTLFAIGCTTTTSIEQSQNHQGGQVHFQNVVHGYPSLLRQLMDWLYSFGFMRNQIR